MCSNELVVKCRECGHDLRKRKIVFLPECNTYYYYQCVHCKATYEVDELEGVDNCVAICRQIQEVFGHRVDPRKLEELIESSPLEPLDEECGTCARFPCQAQCPKSFPACCFWKGQND